MNFALWHRWFYCSRKGIIGAGFDFWLGCRLFSCLYGREWLIDSLQSLYNGPYSGKSNTPLLLPVIRMGSGFQLVHLVDWRSCIVTDCSAMNISRRNTLIDSIGGGGCGGDGSRIGWGSSHSRHGGSFGENSWFIRCIWSPSMQSIDPLSKLYCTWFPLTIG